MRQVDVELIGTSPLLMNACVAVYESMGSVATTDYEIAERKLYRTKRGELFLPTRTILGAIVKAGRDQHPDMFWPRAVNVVETWPRITCTAPTFIPLADWTIERGERFDGYVGVYPRFNAWELRFTLSVDEESRPLKMVRELLEHIGRCNGLPQYTAYVRSGEWGRFEIGGWTPRGVPTVA